MIGIVFSTEEEAHPFLSRYQRGRFEGLSEGEAIQDDQLFVTLMGVGKIKATLRTERLLRNHRFSRLIHVGTCTALSENLKPGTIVAVSQVFEGDRVELATPTYPRMPLEIPFNGLPSVTLVTQDHTVQGTEERGYWQRIADISDMSGYPVAYVAATHGVPCHIVKIVTGHYQSQDKNFRKHLDDACESIGTFLLQAIKELKEELT